MTIFKATSGRPSSIDVANKTMEVILTTKSTDRDGDIVHSDGINFDNYMKNPVVLWAHDPRQIPIAKVEEINQQKDFVLGKVKFASHKAADDIFNLYAEGFLSSWSIGFSRAKEGTSPILNDDGEFSGYEFKSTELLELSAVPVPANPEALTKSLDLVQDKELKKYLKSLMTTEKKEDAPTFADLQKKYVKSETDEEKQQIRKQADDLGFAKAKSKGIFKDGVLFLCKEPLTGEYLDFEKEEVIVLSEKAFNKTMESISTKGTKTNIVFGDESFTSVNFEVVKQNDNIISEVKVTEVFVQYKSIEKEDSTTHSEEPSQKRKNQSLDDIEEIDESLLKAKMFLLKNP